VTETAAQQAAVNAVKKTFKLWHHKCSLHQSWYTNFTDMYKAEWDLWQCIYEKSWETRQ